MIPIDLTTLILFSIATITIVIIPGPNLIYIFSRSVGQRRTVGVMSVLGVDTGFLIHIAAMIIGLSALIMSSALIFNVIKYVGAVYLIYLGIQTLRGSTEHFLDQDSLYHHGNGKKDLTQIFYQGTLTNVLNPKSAIFFLSFFPQFLNPATGRIYEQILILGGIFIFIASSIHLGLALFSSLAGDWLTHQKKFWQVQKLFTGGLLVWFGIGTASTSITVEN